MCWCLIEIIKYCIPGQAKLSTPLNGSGALWDCQELHPQLHTLHRCSGGDGDGFGWPLSLGRLCSPASCSLTRFARGQIAYSSNAHVESQSGNLITFTLLMTDRPPTPSSTHNILGPNSRAAHSISHPPPDFKACMGGRIAPSTSSIYGPSANSSA